MPDESLVPLWSLKNGERRIVAFAMIDPEDEERVQQLTWCLHKAGYAVARDSTDPKRRNIYLQQFVMGRAKKGLVWDHRDRDPLNCRKENLRMIKRGQNGWGNIQNQEDRLTDLAVLHNTEALHA